MSAHILIREIPLKEEITLREATKNLETCFNIFIKSSVVYSSLTL